MITPITPPLIDPTGEKRAPIVAPAMADVEFITKEETVLTPKASIFYYLIIL